MQSSYQNLGDFLLYATGLEALLLLACVCVLILLAFMINRSILFLTKKRKSIIISAVTHRINVMCRAQIYENILSELIILCKRSSFNRQIIIDCILDFYKYDDERSKEILEQIYSKLELNQHSKRKLSSSNMLIVMEGLRELGLLGNSQDAHSVFKLMGHLNAKVCTEARLAIIRLCPHDPLCFLEYKNEFVSRWQKILYYERLKVIANSKMPRFKKYFEHCDLSVVSFSIEMCGHFLQYDAVEKLANFIYHPDLSIKLHAIEALRKLKSKENTVQILYLKHRAQSSRIKFACGKFLEEARHWNSRDMTTATYQSAIQFYN